MSCVFWCKGFRRCLYSFGTGSTRFSDCCLGFGFLECLKFGNQLVSTFDVFTHDCTSVQVRTISKFTSFRLLTLPILKVRPSKRTRQPNFTPLIYLMVISCVAELTNWRASSRRLCDSCSMLA